ncbi:DoxX family protein [Pseudodesulfovibrio cashew]|uniref:DoxX family protein n=1 Tax=Pseudodesulfovibrio cashew TaxID=2678688 RepID=A0A6I6JAF7_9BACT|nr:MauE/DoxX family redox-associated membrane protein [Pseudodesulfovibrio cashew]QGY39746.1 DoxX family protein [Pseudodesulfovibrio cashew]
MLKILDSKLVYRAIGLIVGGVFVFAGISKAGHPDALAATIDGYGLVSWGMATVIARVLPVVEIVSGLALMFDLRGGLGTIVAQLLGFIGVLAYGIHLGLDVDCGCFGPGDPAAAESHDLMPTLIRDVGLLAACLFLYWQRYAAGFAARVPNLSNLFRRTE